MINNKVLTQLLFRAYYLIDQQYETSNCVTGIKQAGQLSEHSFVRVLIPLMRLKTSWPNHLLKAPLSRCHHLGIEFQHLNLGGTPKFKPLISIYSKLYTESVWEVVIQEPNSVYFI